jgi:L-ascorbate metabolism protein UlaG (beta-lactamase superfamily)
MDILWHGQSCFKIKDKTTSVIVDPFDPTTTGLKLPKDLTSDLLLVTHQHQDHNNTQAVSGDPVVIAGPGEYEVKGVSVVGIHSYHDKTEGSERGKNTIYQINIEGVNIVHLGDLGHPLTEEQTGEFNEVDILMIPVGGNYTIDAEEAAKVVASLEPKIVIPMHYKSEGSSADIAGVEGFLKEMGAENTEAVSKLTITRDKLPEETQVVLIAKS